MSLVVKEFWKSSIFGEVMDKSRVSCFFDSLEYFLPPPRR